MDSREKGGILNGLQDYWTQRAESYSRQILEEMEVWKRDAWRSLILENAPAIKRLRILDVGTGPGFFAINLALAGHETVGIDVTEEMLEQARSNARAYQADAQFHSYDGIHLPFGEESFDLVISRNVTWNIEDLRFAFSEWKRVLKKGGRLLYFDANWYRYLVDEEEKRRRDQALPLYRKKYPEFMEENEDPLGKEKTRMLEELARRLPQTRELRPAWDIRELEKLGMHLITVEESVNERIYDEAEKVVYSLTPMFMVCAVNAEQAEP